MTLVFITGDIGTGKTLLATALALAFDGPVISNYRIDHPNYIEATPARLATIDQPTLVILDEAYTWLESRVPGQVLQLYMSYILFQSRKRKIDFVTTCQIPSSVDLRFRELADYWIQATNDVESYRYEVVKNSLTEGYPSEVLELPKIEAEKIYPYYDTYQLVGDIQGLLDRIDPSESLPHVYEIADKLMSEYPNKRWTKGALTDYCLEHRLPDSYPELLYNRIQRLQ
jgi:hypothetical protein